MKVFVVLAILLISVPGFACDGDPPELVNKDLKSYSYQIRCASKTEEAKIEASAKIKLEGKSGCQLKLGDRPAVKLFTEMVCEIQAGRLSCDLI